MSTNKVYNIPKWCYTLKKTRNTKRMGLKETTLEEIPPSSP